MKSGDNEGKYGPKGAVRRKQAAVTEQYDAAFRGYINLNLTAEQKELFERWRGTASPWEVLEYNVGDGVHIALKFEQKNNGYLGSATQRRAASPNAGLCVTARGRDVATAYLRLLFCLVILGHEERWEDVQAIVDPDRW